MAVTSTQQIELQALPLPSPGTDKYYPIHRLLGYNEVTGDATAGDSSLVCTFPNNDIYYLITSIQFCTNESTANQTLVARIVPSEWEDYKNITGPNSVFVFWAADVIGDNQYQPEAGKFNIPFYLGKPVKGSTPDIRLRYPTNTDTKVYSSIIRGYAYRQAPILYSAPLF